ncbi:hypothetical protein [Streptomyces sp. NPDC060002]|uniref:hypothetical protein n=1 Tax=Streptomyces sp. NPDC060002 TaxID=3347033 RepID=UPI0036AA69F0
MFFQRAGEQKLMREYGVQHESWGPLAEGGQGFFDNPVLGDIARAHDKSVAQIALRRLVQREIVAIPKSVRPERMAAGNLANAGFDAPHDAELQCGTINLDALTSHSRHH